MTSDQTTTPAGQIPALTGKNGSSLMALPENKEAAHERSAGLPRMVTDCTDLVAIVRDHRKSLSLSQFETDMISGNHDGYGSKLEGPGRHYGRRPTRLTKPLSVRFDLQAGEISSVMVGASVSVRSAASSLPIITMPASCWLEAMGLALVLVDRKQGEELCKPPVPWQRRVGQPRTGRKVRRVTTAFEVSGIGNEPNPVAAVNPGDLRACAKALAKAKRAGSVAKISRAIAMCRAAGIDPEALSAAVQMTNESALAMAARMARTAAYLHALGHPDVRVSQCDSVEHARDMLPAEIETRNRQHEGWLDIVGR